MSPEILSLPTGTVSNLMQRGEMTVLTGPPVIPPRERSSGGLLVDQARDLFGEDFCGAEDIIAMQDKCTKAGIDVAFEIPAVGFDISAMDLEYAKEDVTRGRERFVSQRPEFMVHNGERKHITFHNLRELFKKETVVAQGGQNVTVVTYDNNPFGDGPVFRKDNTWHNQGQDFAAEPLKPGYALPTKEALADSVSKKWDDQQKLLQPGEKRRTAVETIWDSLLYYSKTGDRLLSQVSDWTDSRSSHGNRVHVWFLAGGVGVNGWRPGDANPNLGVCPTR